jgi:hypothetical protein
MIIALLFFLVFLGMLFSIPLQRWKLRQQIEAEQRQARFYAEAMATRLGVPPPAPPPAR